MVKINLGGYAPTCEANSGGISRVFVADPADLEWTASTATYQHTAVALSAGATLLGGGGFHEIKFDNMEGELKFDHSVKGSSNKYQHSLELQVPRNGKELTKFLVQMQQATMCGSLCFVIEQQNGRVMVMGESVVNAETIPFFRVIMDGTKGMSGKAFDDVNGANVVFKGDYSRPLYEFTGGIDAIIALLGS